MRSALANPYAIRPPHVAKANFNVVTEAFLKVAFLNEDPMYSQSFS
jgi:hypothetical protein